MRLAALLLIVASCAKPFPETPDELSVQFECKYSGFTVLRGWLTVDDSLETYLDRIDITSGLECDSSEYDSVECYVVR